MAENQEQNHDDELKKAQKSMGGRIDPDPTPESEKKEEKKDENPPTPPANDPEKKPESDEGKKDIKPDNQNPEGGDKGRDDKDRKPRDERFIPLKKWHDRETQHKTEVEALEAKITELKSIAQQKPGDQKDTDIEAFMEKTGFDKETVEGLLKLAKKQIMTPELEEALQRAGNIVKESEMGAQFESEFKDVGQPALKEHLPEIEKVSAEVLEKVKDFLDKVAHTKEFASQPLDYVIFKHRKELKEIIGEPAQDAPAPKDKKTMETGKPGGGKQPTLNASDFKGKKDFSDLVDMEEGARSELIKSFDNDTYQNYYQWVAKQDAGVEVMRDGRRIKLK